MCNYSFTEPMDNSTSFGSENSTNGTDNLSMVDFTLPRFVGKLQAMTYIAELILGVSLSLFLIFLILFSKSLRQRGFAVAVQILLANVAFAVPVLSTSAHAALAGDWTLGDGACQFIAFCNQLLQPLRWLLTAVLAIDRALTINRPLKYEKHGAKFVAIASACAFLVAFLIGIIPPIALPTCNEFLNGINSCQLSGERSACAIYGYAYFTVLLLVGGVLPFSLYIWMFYKAKNAGRQVVPVQDARIRLSTAASVYVHGAVSRKQLITLFLLFWTLLGCLLPHYVAYIFTYIFISSNLPSTIVDVGGVLIIITQPLYYALIIADPVALMWHKDVKNELRKIKNRLGIAFSFVSNCTNR